MLHLAAHHQPLTAHLIKSIFNSETTTSNFDKSSREAQLTHSSSDEFSEASDVLPAKEFPCILDAKNSNDDEEISMDEISEESFSDGEDIEIEDLLECALSGFLA